LIQGVMKIPDGCALLQQIDHDLVPGEQLRVQLLLPLIVGADGRDEGSRGHILPF